MNSANKVHRQHLADLQNAAKSMKGPNDVFHIRGDHFSCEWNGKAFIWTAPSGNKYTISADEVIQNMGDGAHITEHCYGHKHS